MPVIACIVLVIDYRFGCELVIDIYTEYIIFIKYIQRDAMHMEFSVVN